MLKMIRTAIFVIVAGCTLNSNALEYIDELCVKELNITIDSDDPDKEYPCLEECHFDKQFPFLEKSATNITYIALEYLSKPCSTFATLEDTCERGKALMECESNIDREISNKCKNSTNTPIIDGKTADELGCYNRCVYLARNWIDEDNVFNFEPLLPEETILKCYDDNKQTDLCVEFTKVQYCIENAFNETMKDE